MIGRTLLHFKITARLGEGGMGEVYRAEDTRLGRDVAIKVLPEAFTEDPERLARFEREAMLLASLNHPHIAVIHGLEEADGTSFIVMELVDGETVESQVARGALPIDVALDICRQVADAVAAAHEQGIVHRDLKPSNVMVSRQGGVKVLDFGLAKALKPIVASGDLTEATTESQGLTSASAILGTLPYMSPEQVRGEDVDKRTDIWSFGCLLFEALTGNRAFARDTGADTVSAIVEQEPDWAALPSTTPHGIRTLLTRCLKKDAQRRLRDIGDARIEIEEELSGTASTNLALESLPGTERRLRSWIWVLAVIAGLSAVVAVLSLLRTPSLSPDPPKRLAIVLPPGEQLDTRQFPSSIAISPDGSYLAYVSRDSKNRARLHLRAFDEFGARAIPGTEGATGPFFSPDGQWLGFFASAKMQKVPVTGGAVTTISSVPKLSAGASWLADDTIVFASFGSGLQQVSTGGGAPIELTSPNPENGELGHAWPQVLPGGRDVLFTVAQADRFDLAVLSLETKEWRTVVNGPSWGRVLPSGQLIYLQQGEVWAKPFDFARNEPTGSPVSVLEDAFTSDLGVPYVAVSDSGTLVYATDARAAAEGMLMLVDREGNAIPVLEKEDWYSAPRFSPEGERVAVGILADIWVIDTARGTQTRLTHSGENIRPIWSPDGTRIAFASDRSGTLDLYWAAADAGGEPELLYESEYPQWPVSWSPDGQTLLFCELNPRTGGDIGALPVGDRRLEGPRVPAPILATWPDTPQASVSPDGRWLAYVSDESDSGEVYVQPLDGEGEKRMISTEGGEEPLWSWDGQELFYRNGRRMMVVAVQTDPTFDAGVPRLLFEGPYALGYDVSKDGQRFLMVERPEAELAPIARLNVVLDWFGELESSVLAGQ